MTTEERLYKLEGIVEGVMATLPGQVASLEQRMELLRQELRAESADLRQEMKAEIAGLRQEVKAEIADLRQEVKAEIAGLRQEMNTEIVGLRQEVKAEIAGLRQEMKTEINTALNRLMLYFTALAAVLAFLTLFR
jgi:F0F1-type ATP synthase membrane subunit b/b'